MVKVGVVGGNGYTGAELLRLLSGHPEVTLTTITSRSQVGRPVSDTFPGLRGRLDQAFSPLDIQQLAQCDLVFFATPNGTAMHYARQLLESGVRIIDLAADFRLQEEVQFNQWYDMAHACPELLQSAVYGLPEVNRALIRQAHLLANPGCYPTATQLGLLPLVEAGLISGNIIVDAKSGVSGAGRSPRVSSLLCEAGESFRAYSVAGHRHLPEIRQGLSRMKRDGLAQDWQPELTFVPHLVPMIRGIHATLYCTIKDYTVDLQALFEQRFEDEPFVDVLPAGSHPETRTVKGCNQCRLAVHRPQNSTTVVILSVIDNLVKGAAGQAVQNMNIMFDLDETAGLEAAPLTV